MIHLKTHKVIFVKPRKVAGTSFELLLSKYSGANDVITPLSKADELKRISETGVMAQNYGYRLVDANIYTLRTLIYRIINGLRLQKYYNHMSLKEIKMNMNQDDWERCKKVSIIRDPADYILSYYFHNIDRSIDFELWYYQNKRELLALNRSYFIDGKCEIDFFIYYNDIENSFIHLELLFPFMGGVYDIFRSIKTKDGRRPGVTKNVLEFYRQYPKIYEDIETSFAGIRELIENVNNSYA
jgi:hypothetical protein